MGSSWPFLSDSSRHVMFEAYDRRVRGLSVEVESRTVPTRFGEAHLLVAGPENAPPILAPHGLNMGAARNLGFLLSLTERFRVYAPDTPGQPGKSAPARLDWGRHEYGCWVVDLLDGLGLERAHAVGVSFGAAMLLDAAAVAPHRLDRVALIVPAGLARVDLPRVLGRLILPAVLYRLLRIRPLLHLQVSALASQVTDDLLGLFELISRNVMPMRTPPPIFSAAQLRGFRSPTLVYAAHDDLFFRLGAMRRNARRVLPGLVDIAVLPARHIPNEAEQEEINRSIARFLEGRGREETNP
jgi:pimeloyl-ACP methyl ester carboxylesterase